MDRNPSVRRGIRWKLLMTMLNLEIEGSRMEFEEEKESMNTKASMTILLFIIVGAVIIWIEAGQFAAPLTRLTESARLLAKGDFTGASSIQVQSEDEIGTLARAFSRMAKDLQQTYGKLEEYSHTLEEKVEARTRELETVMGDVSTMNTQLGRIVEKMTAIGIALSAETELNRLAELIISHIRAMTHADAGTLYLLENRKLNFLIIQNDSLNIYLGGSSGDTIPFAPVELNASNVSAHVAMSGKSVNIPDVYVADGFDFTGPKKFDSSSGYRSKSMLVVPMKNEKKEIIGVIQLLNAKDLRSGEVVPFSSEAAKLAEAIASQAAVAVNNVRLMHERERLFEEVLNLKNYDESILNCLSNGVICLAADGTIVKCNPVALDILTLDQHDLVGAATDACFEGNPWILNSVERVVRTGEQDIVMDAELIAEGGRKHQVNLTVVPLISIKKEHIGTLLVLEDITGEKRLKGTLARYMTKEVSERLLDSSEEILGGQVQEAAVLFSDIRRFTSISERLGATETVALLNDYFTIMVDIIFDNKGILDKYIGDAIMAAFGVPFAGDYDTDKSVTAAIQMMMALRDFNAHRATRAMECLDMGIGINTDEVLAGNIGSLKRMDYTMIGDGVNLAARLESATKFYGVGILISENSYQRLRHAYRIREVDRIRVKGKSRPAGIYEILDYHNDQSFPNLQDSMIRFQEGLTRYRNREWQASMRMFEECLALNPADKPPTIYIERCRLFAQRPPSADWDGVWVMTSK